MPLNDPDAALRSYRSLALADLEAWLRMNRDGPGWPRSRYEAEIEALAVRYLRGVGWYPPMEFDPLHKVILDAVHEAGIGAWRLATRTEPGGGSPCPALAALIRAVTGRRVPSTAGDGRP